MGRRSSQLGPHYSVYFAGKIRPVDCLTRWTMQLFTSRSERGCLREPRLDKQENTHRTQLPGTTKSVTWMTKVSGQDMEPISNLLSKPDSLVPRSPDGITTAPNASELSEPQWAGRLELMAISKRQDWAPGILGYWTEKLNKFSDEEICAALLLYAGEFFPDPDDIAAIINRKRMAVAEQNSGYWNQYRRHVTAIKEFMQAHDGKTPAQVWCEENAETLRKLNEQIGCGEAAKHAR